LYGLVAQELLEVPPGDKFIPDGLGGLVQASYNDVYRVYFGKVPNAMFTAFEFCTLKGSYIYHDAWFVRNVWTRALMCSMYLIASFAFTSVCIGAVTDKMIILYEESLEDEKVATRLAEKHVLHLLEETFKQADMDGSGTLDRMELFSALESKTFCKYIGLLNLTKADMILLFDAIDYDDHGWVSQKNFVSKILPLRGKIAGITMWSLKGHVKALSSRVNGFLSRAEQFDRELQHQVDSIEWFCGCYGADLSARQRMAWNQVEAGRKAESREKLQSKIDAQRPRWRGRAATPTSSTHTPLAAGVSSLVEPNAFPPPPPGRPVSRSLLPSRGESRQSVVRLPGDRPGDRPSGPSAPSTRRRMRPVREGPPSGPL
jgi:hypothetical protein